MSYPQVDGKSPASYAKMLLEVYFGDKTNAEKEVFNQARSLDRVPCSYWREVFLAIHDS